MKKVLSFVFIAAVTVAFSQPGGKKKDPLMAPELVPGYYVTAKGDTVKGEIQTNPENEGDLYKQINFKAPGTAKVVVITTKKAKAYGYGDKHYMLYAADGNEMYMRYLTRGRLNFVEFSYNSVVAGKPTVLTDYYIQDSKADEANAELRQFKKLNEKFYKKELKPYMKDQAMIWSDMDKFVFKPEAIANSIREFNKMYE
jgi:hypothetical protein